ncbi:MAG: hypothetical protein L3K14_00385 [Thermoplasmata archaeon]|nr:hypothetical protein [Thermoplasmata archaeon]
MVSPAQIVFQLIHGVLSPLTPGVIALAMVLFRELYPNWRPGVFRQRYDQTLAIFAILSAVLAVIKIVGLASVSTTQAFSLNLNPAVPGAIALGMVLVRELYPGWRPGLARTRYDQTLALFVLIAVALAILKVVEIAVVAPSANG